MSTHPESTATWTPTEKYWEKDSTEEQVEDMGSYTNYPDADHRL